MSESSILEYWPEGITAARIPANNNVRLIQALLLNPAISATTAAQPGSPSEGDVYILPASPTGSNWAGFFENDVVIYYNATWTAYTPPEGLRKFVEDQGEDWQFVGDSSGGWAPAGGGGGGADRSTVTSVSSSSGVVTLNYALGDYFTLTLTENVTSWAISNPPGSGKGFSLMVEITQGAGPYTVADPGTAPGGSITVSTGSGDIDVLAITSFNNGTTLRSNLANDYS